METIISRVVGVGWLSKNSTTKFPFPTTHSLFPPILSSPIPRLHHIHAPPPHSSTRLISVSVSGTSPPPVSEVAVKENDDVLQMFFEERQRNGDFVSKVSDLLWQREVMQFVVSENSVKFVEPPSPPPQQPDEALGGDNEGGFLKLTRTQEWVAGDDDSAPINRKAFAKALRDDRERRRKLNLLHYEAIKRELLLLSISIGTACSGYCLIVLSVQAAISYATGVLFSCLYLQLLYRHADNLSKETIPQIFMQKKSKKIGIRSEDLNNFFERTVKGSGIALSSPRLVIPAAIYGLWVLSHQHFANDIFDFQIVPAMFGMLVYKAAALVQVYRDNEDLQLILPDSMGGSSD